jgi:predicted RNA-binding protein associated with RNAse of E/G family
VSIGPDRWSTTDLFLDLWSPASGAAVWLDQDEFDAALKAGVIDLPMARRTHLERERIAASHAAGHWPPPVTREIDLGWITANAPPPA